jgi:hypothetical protein
MNEQTGAGRPVLAIVAFIGAFLFAALGSALDSENPLVVAPFVIVSLCCTILFMRLLIGEMRWAKWIWLGLGIPLCYAAGDEWYLVVLLMCGTHLGTLLIARLIGNFDPIVRNVNH